MTKQAITIVIVAAIAGAVGICGWAYFAIPFMGDSMESMQEGGEFGKGKESQACIDEAVRRYQPSRGMFEQTADSSFVLSCLTASKRTNTFCVGLPDFSVWNNPRVIGHSTNATLLIWTARAA